MYCCAAVFSWAAAATKDVGGCVDSTSCSNAAVAVLALVATAMHSCRLEHPR
jgi:hypothetical protein